MPQAGEVEEPGNIFGEWGHDGTCFCCMGDVHNQNPSINFLINHVRPTLLQLFELLFPMDHVKFVILPMINKEIDLVARMLSMGSF